MKRIGLLFIVLLAFILRIYRISDVPPALSLDEVSIGYNAYSILITGADEYGTKLPLLLRAYDDWRPAFYVYLVVPSIKLFGLTPFGVRLPSVLAGTLTILLTYFLVLELFGRTQIPEHNDQQGKKSFIGHWVLSSGFLAVLSALLLAISPWHIYLSRLSHEVNLGLTFIVLGVYSFFRAIGNKKHVWWTVVSAVAFGLSLNSYQSQKIIAPVLVISLGLLYWKQLVEKKKQLIISVFIGLFIALPIIIVNLQPGALIRLRATSAFPENQRKITSVQIFVSNYISHFRPAWLFAGGDRESHKVPGLGLMYIWEAPLIILGMFWLLRSGFDARLKAFILLWLFSAPLPAAITTQAPHAMRSFTFLPVWQILAAMGFVTLWKKPAMYAWMVLGVLTVGSSGYFAKQYFEVFPRTQSNSFQYALTKAIPVALDRESQYERVVFSNSNNLYQSYMFFLFYSRYDPELYQKEGGTYSGGFAETHKIGKFEFRPISWEKEQKNGKTLYVGNVTDFPNTAPDVVISHLDGTPAVAIVGS
ncbi:MAG: glycosyltransferase family 39 protein [Patescibacteria group bacterium]